MLWAKIKYQYTREGMEDWLFNSKRKELFHTRETRRIPLPHHGNACWEQGWERRNAERQTKG